MNSGAGRRLLIEKSGLTAHSCEECISADVGGEDEDEDEDGDGWEGILDSDGGLCKMCVTS